MKRVGAFVARWRRPPSTVARGGHELPIYPSYLSARDRDQDARSRPRGRRAARGQDPGLCRAAACALRGTPPAEVRADRIARRVRHRARQSGFGAGAGRGVGLRRRQGGRPRARATAERFHPASLSGHAVARRLSPSRRSRRRRQGAALRPAMRRLRDLKVKASGELRASGLVGDAARTGTSRSSRSMRPSSSPPRRLAMNGWIAPPWLRTGWFHAERLLADAAGDPARRQRRRIRSAAAQGRRFQRRWSSASIWSATWSRRSPAAAEDRRRLHGQARIRQCRILGRNREHRLRCDRGSAFADLHPHGEAQGFSLERLARARHRRRAGGRLEPDRRHDRSVRTADVASRSAIRRCCRRPTRPAGCSIASPMSSPIRDR